MLFWKKTSKKEKSTDLAKQFQQRIEEWSGYKVGDIVFDSDVHNMKKQSCQFVSKLYGRSHLLFIVAENTGKVFGGYKDGMIDQVEKWLSDEKAFLFRVDGELIERFEIKKKRVDKTFYLYDDDYDVLFSFGFGIDLCVCKSDSSQRYHSRCRQESFNYNESENALCGKEKFECIRLIVVQLI